MLRPLHWQLPSLKCPWCFGGSVLTKPRLWFQNQAVSQHSGRSGSPWAVVLQTIKSSWLKIPPLNSQVFLCLISFSSSFLYQCFPLEHINFLPGDTSWQMCQFVLFWWDTVILSNSSSLPITLRATLSGACATCLSINFISLPPITLKRKWRLPGVNFLNLSLPITFFSYFPHPFFYPIWSQFLWISRRICHSTLDFESISLCPFSPLLCFFDITLSTCTFLKPRLSQPASPCSIPWKAALTGPPATHHLPCISQIFVLCP